MIGRKIVRGVAWHAVACLAAFLLVFALSAKEAFAQQALGGQLRQTLVFGQTAAFHGQASSLGAGAKIGIRAAFEEANRKGTLEGVKLSLVSYDDGYEPDMAIENVRRLLDQDHVFALIGSVGTPTSNAVIPMLGEKKVPYIGAFTGATFLRQPFKRYVVNLRASYSEETEKLVDYLVGKRGLTRIAVLFQDDTYGRSGLEGVKAALDRRKLELAGEGSYMRNTISVKTAVLAIRKSAPQAVILVGTNKACAQFIKVSLGIGFAPVFANLSFAGTDALAGELADQAQGVLVSQVIPYPYESADNSELVRRYHAALKAYDPSLPYDYLSMEGYMVGRLAIEVLAHMEKPYTREGFIDKVYELKDIALDDVTLHFGPDDNQGMDKVYLTVLQKGGKIVAVEEAEK